MADLFDTVPDELRASMLKATSTDPEAHARVLNLATKLNLPPDVVAINPAWAQHQVDTQLDAEKLTKDYPGTAKFLADPNRAAVSHDELIQHMAMEDTLRNAQLLEPGLFGKDVRDTLISQLRERGHKIELVDTPAYSGDFAYSVSGLPAPSQQAATPEAQDQKAAELYQLPQGFFERLITGVEKAEPVPFLGAAVEGLDIYNLTQLANRVKDGTAEDKDWIELLRYDAEMRRGTDFGGKVAAVLVNIPAFAGEIAATGGVFTAGAAGARKAGLYAAKKILNKSAEEVAKSALLRGGIRAAGWVAGSVAQATVGMPHRVAVDAMQRLMPKMQFSVSEQGQIESVISDSEDGFASALTKAIVNQSIEVGTESAGAFIGKVTGLEALKAAVMTKWFKLNPTSGWSQFNALLRKAKWDGVLEEFGEERLGELLRAAAGLEALKLDPEQYAVELVSFAALPMAGAALTGPGMIRQSRQMAQAAQTQVEFFRDLGEQAQQSKTRTRVPGMLGVLGDLAAQDGPVQQVFAPIEAWNQHFTSKGIDPRQMAQETLGSTEAYDKALEAGHDLEIPIGAYVEKIAPTEHNEPLSQVMRLGSVDAPNVAEMQAGMQATSAAVQEMLQLNQDYTALTNEQQSLAAELTQLQAQMSTAQEAATQRSARLQEIQAQLQEQGPQAAQELLAGNAPAAAELQGLVQEYQTLTAQDQQAQQATERVAQIQARQAELSDQIAKIEQRNAQARASAPGQAPEVVDMAGEVYNQLMATGNTSDRVARAHANMFARMAYIMANRAGMNLQAFKDRFTATILGDKAAAPAGTTLSQEAQRRDAEYMTAVEAGDMETAQRLVDEAAKAAGYMQAWHSGPATAQIENSVVRTPFMYFTDTKENAEQYNRDQVGRWFIKTNPFVVDEHQDQFIDFFSPQSERFISDSADAEDQSYKEQVQQLIDDAVSEAKAAGHDGIEMPSEFDGKPWKNFIVFSPNQIKSAEPVTRDADGNVITLSERFDPALNSILYQQQRDAQYMAAVAAGDMDTAQRLVDEAAKAAGYNESGSHGLGKGELADNRFKRELLGSQTKAPSAKLGFFFASTNTANSYAKKVFEKTLSDAQALQIVGLAKDILAPVLDLIPSGINEWIDSFRDRNPLAALDKRTIDPGTFLKITDAHIYSALISAEFELGALSKDAEIKQAVDEANKRYESEFQKLELRKPASINVKLMMQNPAVYDQQGKVYREVSYVKLIKAALDAGHDSVIIKNTYDGGPLDDVKVVFNPSQIKSADPVTRDADGNVIPLSERFNPEQESILYQKAPKANPLDLAPAEYIDGRGTVSTRQPTSVKAQESEKVLQVNLEAVNATEVLKGKVADGIRNGITKGRSVQYITNEQAAGNDDQVIRAFIDLCKGNLRWLWNQFPAQLRDRAKLWYVGANKIADACAERYSVTTEQAAGVFAVLSPQKDWFQNVSMGERVMQIWERAKTENFVFTQELFDYVYNTDVRQLRKDASTKYVKKAFKPRTWSSDMNISEEEFNAQEQKRRKEHNASEKKRKEKPQIAAAALAKKTAAWDAKRVYIGKRWSELGLDGRARLFRALDETTSDRSYRIILPEGGRGEVALTGEGQPAVVAWSSYNFIAKALSILDDGSIANISEKLGNEHKVRNFFNNISDPHNKKGYVTIDTHAVAAALLNALSGSSEEVADNFGGAGGDSLVGISGTYGVYAEAYNELAEELTKELGVPVLAREVQSVTWEAVRLLFPKEDKTSGKLNKNLDAIWKEYADEKRTIEDVRRGIWNLSGGIRNPSWSDTGFGFDAQQGGVASGIPDGGPFVPLGRRAASLDSELPARGSAKLARGVVRGAEADQEVTLNQDVFPPVAGATPLVALHNISEQNLLAAAKLGGLAAPSIGVTRPDALYTNFGDITLIGSRDIADPRRNPVFNADAYTVRFPSPEYGKMKTASALKILKPMLAFQSTFRDYTPDEAFDLLVNRGQVERAIDKLQRSEAAKVAFLQTKGITVKPVMRDADAHYFWTKSPIIREYMTQERLDAADAGSEDERRAMVPVIEQAIREELQKQGADQKAIDYSIKAFRNGAISTDGGVAFMVVSRIRRDLNNAGTQVVDTQATSDAVDQALGDKREFDRWIQDQILAAAGEPKLIVGRKKVPFTLENIVQYMTSSKGAGAEDTMTFGEGKARAVTASRMSDVEEMRNRAESEIAPTEDVKAARDAASKLVRDYQIKVTDHYKYSSTFSAMDSSMKALARWAKSGVRTTASLQKALRAEDFENVPNDILELGVEAGNAFLSTPVPYFESKPQRAVALSEFKAAVIPATTGKEARDALAQAGVPVVEYNPYDIASREAAVRQAADQEQALFQRDVDFRPEVLTEAAQQFKDGNITREEYNRIAAVELPLNPFTEVPTPASMDEVLYGLGDRKAGERLKRDLAAKPEEIPAQTLESRLDIPAYREKGVWVVTLHEDRGDKSKGSAASPVAYTSTAVLNNVTFKVHESAALAIAAGKPKGTIATMRGDYKPMSAEDAAALAEQAMEEGWAQVGMNPLRHSYFYDKNDERPVVSAEQVVQVGGMVLAKNPVYGEAKDYLFQNENDARGSISFNPTERGAPRRAFTVRMLKKANASTFMHEASHFYLEVFNDLASDADAPAGLREDWDRISKWLGLQAGVPITVEQHETFARGFERYLMEGKAPAEEVRSFFAQMRQWLVRIYRDLLNLNVEISDDIRGVFDRMVATDTEIAAEQTRQKVEPLFGTKPEGMEDAAWERYRKAVEKASLTARERLQSELEREMVKAQSAEREAETARTRDQVIKDLAATREHIALALLRFGRTPGGDEVEVPFKIDKQSLLDAEIDKDSLDSLRRLGIYRVEGGVPVEMAAEMLGYGSVDELVRDLVSTQPFEKAVDTETQRRMQERHPSLMESPAQMREAAAQAVRNEHRDDVIAAEIAELQRLVRRDKEAMGRVADMAPQPLGAIARRILRSGPEQANAARILLDSSKITVDFFKSMALQVAQQQLAGMKLRDIRPSLYLAAARAAGARASRLAAAGDFAGALGQKEAELLNHLLYRESRDMQKEAQKQQRYLLRMTETPARERLGKASPSYRDQVDQLLERFNFIPIPLTQVDRRMRFADWITQQEENGLTVEVDPAVRDEAFRKDFREMTAIELTGVYEAVKQIDHLAKLKTKLLTAQDERDFRAVVQSLVAQITSNTPAKPRTMGSKTAGEKTAEGWDAFFAAHRKLASLIREMDGFVDMGPVYKAIMAPINQAGDREAVETEKATEAILKLFEAYEKDELKRMTRKQLVRGASKNFNLSLEDRLAIALNWGNEDNRQKLIDGYTGLNEQDVLAILDTLTEKDWKFVQSVWDYIDSFWPRIRDKQERIYGIPPGKIEPTTVVTKFGTFRGGYYPLKYAGARAEGESDADAAKMMMRGAMTASTTRRGHTKERVEGVERPIRLDLGVLTEHVTQVIHDLTHHEMLIDVNRLLRNRSVMESIADHYGEQVYRQLRKGLEAIAVGNTNSEDRFTRALGHLRAGASVAGLGFNLMTSMMQAFGLTNAIPRVGAVNMAKAVGRWLGSRSDMEDSVAWIYERSDMMRLRGKTMNRELNEIRNTVDPKFQTALMDSYFYLIQKGQMLADVPTWLGAYHKAMEAGYGSDQAVQIADQTVIDTQGGGQIKDLAAVQRGGPLLKMWTTFYSYFNALWNMNVETVKRTNFKSPADMGRMMVDLLVLNSVPVALQYALTTALRGGSGDDEEWYKQLTKQQLSYALAQLVFVRELGGIMDGRNYEGPAGGRFFAESYKLARQVEQGEMDRGLWVTLNKVGGILFHYPSVQLQRTVEGMKSLWEGKTSNPAVLIIGPSKEER